jgi:hypothetical protein
MPACIELKDKHILEMFIFEINERGIVVFTAVTKQF